MDSTDKRSHKTAKEKTTEPASDIRLPESSERPNKRRARVFDRLKKLRRYHGWGAVAEALWLYLVRVIARYEVHYVYTLDKAPPGLPEPTAENPRFATNREAEMIGESPSFPLITLTIVKDRIERGHRLLLNVVEGEVAGYGWMNPHEIYVEGVDVGIEQRPNEIYIYDAYTHRKYRGQRLGHLRIMFWLKYLKTIGRDTIVTDFAFDNRDTLTRVAKFGFKKIGAVRRLEIGPFKSVRARGEIQSRTIRVVHR